MDAPAACVSQYRYPLANASEFARGHQASGTGSETMIWSACCLAMLVASLEFRVIDQATVALWGAAIAPQDNCATEFFARL